jgi:glycosyltransferase involved in cell wall biosynthesis
VSVVVPCRNESIYVQSFLENVLAQEAPPGDGGIEIIVADGRSEDGTREQIAAISARDPRVRLIDNPGRIVSTGLNAAVRAAHGEIIVRMDVHTEYAPDYVRQCAAVLEETGADNVGGPWVARGETYVARAIAAAFQSPFSVGNARGHDPHYEGPLDTVYLGCWRRELLLEQEEFDEQLVRNQDDEHNLRLTLAGGVVWQSPRIKSWYRPRSSLVGLFRQYSQYGYWKVRVIQKHGRPASPRHLVPALFILGIVLGWIPALFWSPLAWTYVAGWAVYLALDLFFSARVAATAGWDLLPILPAVFPVFHAGYGVGFTLSIVDCVLSRRGARASMSSLTRPFRGGTRRVADHTHKPEVGGR